MTTVRVNNQKAPRSVNKAGAHSRAVGENVRRLRKARGISTYELSALLAEKGRRIQASSLSRLESGERRADVDDVMVLAVILRVSPTALMLPCTAEGDVEIEGYGEGPARAAWAWMDGRAPLDGPSDEGYEEAYVDHQLHSRPQGLRAFFPQSHPSESGVCATTHLTHHSDQA